MGRIVKTGVHRKYLIKLANRRQLWRNREYLRPFKEALSDKPGGDNGGGIRRKRVTLQENETKMKENHRSGLKCPNRDVHPRKEKTQKRLKRNKSKVNYKNLTGF